MYKDCCWCCLSNQISTFQNQSTSHFRDLKSANISWIMISTQNSQIFGLAKLGPVGDNTHSTSVRGTYGYGAPEYAMSGKLTLKSDIYIYSFGVVLLELITGRKAIDTIKKHGEQNMVSSSCPFLKNQKKFGLLVDTLIRGCYPCLCLNYSIASTAVSQRRSQLSPTFW